MWNWCFGSNYWSKWFRSWAKLRKFDCLEANSEASDSKWWAKLREIDSRPTTKLWESPPFSNRIIKKFRETEGKTRDVPQCGNFKNFPPRFLRKNFVKITTYFTKELYRKLISRKFFEMGENIRNYHTVCTFLVLSQKNREIEKNT